WNYEFKNFIYAKRQQSIIKYFNTFDHIIVLAETFKQQISELNIHSTKISVVTTGIDKNEFKSLTKKNESESTLNILFLSRIEKAKGITEFIESLPKVVEQFPNIRYHIAGSGDYLDSIKIHPVALSYSEHIIFHGYIRGKKKLNLFKNSDLFVFPSYSEGCPVSVLEALAAGLPIIFTEVGALPDILKNNINGIKVAKQSSKEIAEAIISLMDNETLRKNISIENLKYSSNFDLTIIHKKLETIYTTL
ncbi:MAG: glycosyltransferase family 4 protein, partial [Candidatus Delongbacteria bacterium]|nr:glycosyltransferase family 4 protein [Candidatus Delongbacteria bacterium]